MSKKQLVAKTLVLSLLIAFIVGLMSLWVSPKLRAYQTHLIKSSPAQMLLGTITAGRFHVSPNNDTIYYIESINRQRNHVENIFVASEKNGNHDALVPTWQVTSAKTGYQFDDPKSGSPFIVAVDGFRYIGAPGEKNFRLVKFREYGMRLDEQEPSIHMQHAEMSNTELWQKHHDDKNAMAELQWRLVLPISVPFLAMLAVPLSYVKPRQGRYSQLLPAILLYIMYANLIYVAKDWVQNGTVSPLVGVWWLPASVFVLSLVLLHSNQTRGFLRSK